jgi:hypothetical protein
VRDAEVDLPYRRRVVVDEPQAALGELGAEFHFLHQFPHHARTVHVAAPIERVVGRDVPANPDRLQ